MPRGAATLAGSHETRSAPTALGRRDRALLADTLVFSVLLLVYSHTFTADYAMKDEMYFVGFAPAWPKGPPLENATKLWRLSGRWLGGLLSNLPFAFAADDPSRLRLVRLALVVVLATLAVVTRRLLDRTLRDAAFTTLLTLAIFAQSPFWAHAGYSAGTFWSASSLLLAVAAFALAVPADGDAGLASWPRLALAFACLALVMQVHQGMAFFGLVPLVVAVLVDWPRRARQSWSLLLLMILALVASAAVYKWNLSNLHAKSHVGYDRGEQAAALAKSPLTALRVALDPRHYWPAFKFWSFPFPFERVRALGPRTVSWALRIMVAWSALVAVAAAVDARRNIANWRELAAKWATVLVCLGLACIPILADSPRGIPDPFVRPHTSIVATGVVLAMAAWALRTLSERWPPRGRRLLAAGAVVLVAAWCAGARSSLRRGIVAPAAAQLSFVRSAFEQEGEVSRILVVVPSRNGCPFEPCDGWSGLIAPDELHVRCASFYRWAHALEGGRTGSTPEVRFLAAPPPLPRPEGDVVVDWNDFVRAQARRKGLDWPSMKRRAGPASGPPPARGST